MSVRKRGKIWIAIVYDRRAHKNRWVGSYDSRAEAKAAEREALTKPKRYGVETCDSFANRWIRDYPRPKESSNKSYRERIKKFAKDFEGRPLNDLDPAEVERWAVENRSRAKIALTMFNDAKRLRLVDENPFVGLRLPTSKGRRDAEVPTEDQVVKLAEAAYEIWGPNYHAWVMCAAYTGIRPGELARLTWDDVDLVNDEITLPADITKNGRERTVVLLEQAKDSLLALPRDKVRVFESVDGYPMSPSTWTNYWHRVRKKAGLDGMHFYVLRHWCASYLLNTLEVAAQDVAAQLGHIDGGVLVLRLYGHPSDRLARKRIKQANSLRLGPEPLRDVSKDAAGRDIA